MISFREHYLLENNRKDLITQAKEKFPSKKKYKWNGNPKIGWWKDRNSIILYHGTNVNNLLGILESGIYAPKEGPTAGWVSLALEPNTSWGYASMGGESAFRAAGSKARHVPNEERIVFVMKFPVSYLEKHIEKDFRGNVVYTRNRLTDKSEYEAWKKSDQEYYAMTELRIPKHVDEKFIIGYMVK